MEPFYPLHVRVCDRCYLVQLDEYVSPEQIFTEYAYFSSYATTWLQHAKSYAALVRKQFGLNANSQVVEIASNDGYLLRNFVEMGIPVLGVEPAMNISRVAISNGIPTLVEFFGSECARGLLSEGKQADLLIGNNVLAQVPDINDFIAGLKILLKPQGVITLEFPHLLRMVLGNQFDTIYHEHFSYFSFHTVEKILACHALTVFDVEELPTHGGSLRIYARHHGNDSTPVSPRTVALRRLEEEAGVLDLGFYSAFSERVKKIRLNLLTVLLDLKKSGKSIAGYGAPGKGNTLLNYCGIRTDLLDYTVDRNPYKQGKYLPGTHIPIFPPEKIRQTRPDYLFILPWNFKEEIMQQNAFIREWGGQFILPIPEVLCT